MNALVALVIVAVLFLVVYLGVDKAGLDVLFGIIVPYVAIFSFLLGFI
jgi:hypothetical protein